MRGWNASSPSCGSARSPTNRWAPTSARRWAQKERELREAEARAKQPAAITESDLSIQVQANAGKASLARAEADRMRLMGEGEANKVVALAAAEAERTTKVGLAQAEAIRSQVEASGGARYQHTRQVADRIAQALETSKVAVVPKISIRGGGGGGGWRDCDWKACWPC